MYCSLFCELRFHLLLFLRNIWKVTCFSLCVHILYFLVLDNTRTQLCSQLIGPPWQGSIWSWSFLKNFLVVILSYFSWFREKFSDHTKIIYLCCGMSLQQSWLKTPAISFYTGNKKFNFTDSENTTSIWHTMSRSHLAYCWPF